MCETSPLYAGPAFGAAALFAGVVAAPGGLALLPPAPHVAVSAVFWVDLTTVAFVLAAVALLIDRRARLAARLLAIMLALFALLVWTPRLVAQPAEFGNWSEFAATLLIAAAFLALALFDAEDVQRRQP